MDSSLQISIIIPAKDEEESIGELCAWIQRAMEAYAYEIIFIDDGSTDGTWQKVQEEAAKNPRIKGIRFNRNFGKSAALQTGFNAAQGDVVVTMDADLQDSPDEIPALYQLIQEKGYHLVSGWKAKRHDPLSKRLPSKFFNAVTRHMSGIQLHDFNCGLKAYRQVVVKNIVIYGEMHRYIPVLAHWAGFTRIAEKVVEHRERKFGHTKFGWERFIRGFLDLLTIFYIGKFERRPMHFFGTWGLMLFFLGFFFTVKMIWDKINAVWITKSPLHREIVDQPIFYLSLAAIIIGIQLFLVGFLAELITRQKASNKKQYLISETLNLLGAQKNNIDKKN